MQTFLTWVAIISCVIFYIKSPIFRHLINSFIHLSVKTLIIILKIPLSILAFIDMKFEGKKMVETEKPTPKIAQKSDKKDIPDIENMSLADQLKWVSSHPDMVRVCKSTSD